MNEGEKIRFAIVGLGHIGKRHGAIIHQHPECEWVAGCDIVTEAEIGLNEYKPDFYFNVIEELLEKSPAFDVLSIATPNGLHEEHALLGLQAGKHVLIEKPMALTKAGCERIIAEAAQQQKMVFCVMQNRYSPVSVWLKDILVTGKLGKIFMVEISCYWNRDERYYTKSDWHGTKKLDGGTLFTQFSHFIDIMFWLFGDITNLNGRFATFNHERLTEFEDSGIIQFDFVNEGMGNLSYSTSCRDKNLGSSITIIAENGMVKVGGQYMNEVEFCHIKDYTRPELPPTNLPNNYGPYKGSAANHHYIFQNIVDVLKGGLPITTNAYEGLKVVEIIERIYSLKK